MKSKEEMIEIIAAEINDSRPGCAVKWDELVKLSQRDGYIVAKGAVRDTRKQAEAALKALCGALPDVNNGSNISNLHTKSKFYNQLKQWGN